MIVLDDYDHFVVETGPESCIFLPNVLKSHLTYATNRKCLSGPDAGVFGDFAGQETYLGRQSANEKESLDKPGLEPTTVQSNDGSGAAAGLF